MNDINSPLWPLRTALFYLCIYLFIFPESFPLVFSAEGKSFLSVFDDMFLEQCLTSPLRRLFSHIYFPNICTTGENSGKAQEDRKREIFAQLCTDIKIALDKYVKRGNHAFQFH